MHLIGRHHNVRPYGPTGWGQPYLLDSKWGTLSPYPCDEWWKSPSGVWHRTCDVLEGNRGNFSLSKQHALDFRLGVLTDSNPVRTAGDLDTAYTAGSAGKAVGARWVYPDTITVAKVYFCIHAYVGTASAVNDLEVHIYGDSSNAPNTGAGAVSGGTGSVDPASATNWIAVTGFTASLTGGTPYYLSVSDADGGATNYARPLRFINPLGTGLRYGSLLGLNTTNGWSTVSRNGEVATFVVVTASESIGQPFDTATTSTSNQRERGLRVSDGFATDLTLYGVGHVSSANISGSRIWQNNDGPTGSPWKSSSAILHGTSGAGAAVGSMFSPVVNLTAATPYRFTTTYSANTTIPGRLQISTTGNSELRAAMPGGGNWYWTTTDGASSWVDTLDEWPVMCLWLENLVTPAGSGGGPLVGAQNLVA